VLPALTDFIGKCEDRDLAVALTSWFRDDEEEHARMAIETPEDLGRAWATTLEIIEDAGLLDSVCYVDLCNEFPGWIRGNDLVDDVYDDPALGDRWMAESIGVVREQFPDQDYCFSFADPEIKGPQLFDVSSHDFLNVHVWMQQYGDFTEELEEASPYEKYYDRLAHKGEEIYRRDPEHWQACLQEGIDEAVAWSEAVEKPIVTTESWAVVHARDWPHLEWDWIKELCEIGARRSAESGRWVGVSTSNFCLPQFTGMWRDVEWHRRVTDAIHDARVDPELRT